MMGLILAMSGTGIFSAYQLNENTRLINYSIIPKMEIIHDMENMTQNVISLSQRHILSKDREFEENYANQIEENISEVTKRLEQYKQLVTKEQEKSQLEEVTSHWNSLLDQVANIIQLSQVGQDEEATLRSYDAVVTANNIEAEINNLNTQLKEELQTVENDGEQLYKGVLIALLVGTALAIILSIIGIRYLLITIQRPIVQLSRNFEKMADGDLTVEPLQFKTSDEIGQLGQGYNLMLKHLQQLMTELQQDIVVLGDTSNNFTKSTDESSEASAQITAAIREVSSGAANQLEGAKTSTTIVENIVLQIEEAAQSTQKVSDLAKQSSQMTVEGSTMMTTTVEKMNEIQQSANQTATAMGILSDKSAEIGTIVSIITKISNQTNLLALNAAIEAARAGEHGKGFSVVANEVGQLATQSAQAAAEITELVKDMQEEANTAVFTTTISTKNVAEGLEIVEQSGKQFHAIAQHVEEVAKQGVMVATIVQGIFNQTEQVKKLVDDVAIMAEQVDGQSLQIVTAAEQQNHTIQELRTSSSILHDMAESLRLRVSKYHL